MEISCRCRGSPARSSRSSRPPAACPSAASSTYRNSRVGVPSPHSSTFARPSTRALDALADQRRDHVRRCEVEIVARAVQVDREQHDAVHAVLLAVGLGHHQHHLLGDAVGGVGLLGIAVPDVVLLERHRRELGIGADGAGGRPAWPRPARRHSSKTLAPIIRFSNRNRPGFSRLAPMPPTRAARCSTMSGRAVGQQPRHAPPIDQIGGGAARAPRRVAPCCRRRSTTKLPRKPAPPVTMTWRPVQKSPCGIGGRHFSRPDRRGQLVIGRPGSGRYLLAQAAGRSPPGRDLGRQRHQLAPGRRPTGRLARRHPV